MPQVKSNNITSKQAPHESGQGDSSGTEEKVGMIGQEGPRITVYLCLGAENLESFNKVLSILIVAKYFPTFYPTNHYVVQNAGSIQSCCPWHDLILPLNSNIVNWISKERPGTVPWIP